jgi:hypothetical protein
MSNAPDQDDADERPWEEPGRWRRDGLPHRARQLGRLAEAALLVSLLSLFLCVPAPVGLLLGVTAWAMARRDVRLMDAGLMDPGGRAKAKEAGRVALVGILNSLFPSLVLCWLGWDALLGRVGFRPPWLW